MINDRCESQKVQRKGSNRWRDELYPFQRVNKKMQREGKGKGRGKNLKARRSVRILGLWT